PEEVDEDFYMWDRGFWNFMLQNKYNIEYIKKTISLKNPHNRIFIGHTPTIRQNSSLPINISNVWNMDTGACFDGRLSIMNLDTQEIYQSEVVRKLYPKEKGRMGKSYS